MGSFSDFRRRANSAKIAEVIKENQNKNDYDDGTWKLEMNKETSTAKAVIRFLPPLDGDLPYEMFYSHLFKDDNGGWCGIDRCPTTFHENCPICEKNSILYKSGNEANKSIVSNRKRRKNYIFNILVRKDYEHPENDGKVFPFKCGPQIYQIIFESISPSFDGDEVKRPFDIDSGHDFNIRIRKDMSKGNMPTYDKSAFAAEATPLADTEEEMERIYNQMTDLKKYVENGRKNEEELQKIADKAYCKTIPVPGVNVSSAPSRSEATVTRMNEPQSDVPWENDGNDIDVAGSEDPMKFFENL